MRKCAECGEVFEPTPYSVRYKLPFSKYNMLRKKSKYGSRTQGFHGTSHVSSLSHAYDTALPSGTKIHAPRSGVVVDLYDEFSAGGPFENLRLKSNFLILRHTDGRYSRYFHLLKNSIYVKVGDKVEENQLLCKSGNSGYTSGPHLHFDVVDSCLIESGYLEIDEIEYKHTVAGFSCDLKPGFLFTSWSYFSQEEENTSADVLIWQRDNVNMFIDIGNQAQLQGGKCLIILDSEQPMDTVAGYIGTTEDIYLDIPVLFLSFSESRRLQRHIQKDSRFTLHQHKHSSQGFPYTLPHTLPVNLSLTPIL